MSRRYRRGWWSRDKLEAYHEAKQKGGKRKKKVEAEQT
jgi:hypothetical protein